MTQSFAYGMNFYKLFWVFFIGCFLGVAVETAWCLFRFHKIESRKGLVYGPFNLVYGFGAVLMTICLYRFSPERDLLAFLLGTFIGGVYEYVCSLVQEKLLGTASWDYKDFPLNLHGRINLLYCFFWGFLALGWLRGFYPMLSNIIERIPNAVGIPLSWCLVAFMLFDTVVSACVVYRAAERESKIAAKYRLGHFLDRHFPDERVRKIYPNMRFDIKVIKNRELLKKITPNK